MNIRAVASNPEDKRGETIRLSAAARRSKTLPWIFVGSGAKAFMTSPTNTSRRNFSGDDDWASAFRRPAAESI